MSKNVKIIIGLGVFALIYLVLFFLVYKDDIFEKKSVYLILDNQVNYLYDKNGFSIIANEEVSKTNYFYDIYVDGENIGKYKLLRGDIWNLFDKDNNYKYLDKYFLGVYGDYPIEINKINIRNLNENEKNLLQSKYKVKISKNLISGKVYESNLDANNIIDKIIISTYYEVGNNPKDFYNLVILILNDEEQVIVNNKGIESNNIYDVKAIFKLGNDKYKTFILETIENIDGDEEVYKKNNNIYQYYKKGYQKI